MRWSNLKKSLLTILPVLAIVIATGLGTFLGKAIYPSWLDREAASTVIVTSESNHLQRILPFENGSCGLLIYTSLPPKCKTSDGSFIPVNGSTPYILVIPKSK